ncbi:MFS transporter [Bacillus sp. M6-12]|uniref:MFS transporter n=1 Tax=Bacillus sp. M6-12 TaxID=2054166 RepID=UPI000C7801E2|nr:MFS transporter [Bacillus sp. M6-12]PLS16105.1 MFS transporter [Bacillus sp. M6-12]
MWGALFRQENQYGKLFYAGVVNGIGDRFSSVAVYAMLLQITGSGFAVGVTLAIRLFPFLFFGPIGGILADRYSKKNILIITDLSRIIFALLLLFVNGKEDIWIVYLVSFFLAAGEAIYSPARKSSIPRLLKDKGILLKVNSLEQVMVGIVLIGGAFSGGIVSFFFGPQFTFWLNGFSFLAAAFIISTITFPSEEKVMKSVHREKLPLSTVKKIILASAPLQLVLLGQIFVALVAGIDNVLISVYAVNVFNLGGFGVGAFYGALGIGLMVSFSAANRLKKNLLVIGIACLMLEGVFLVLQSQIYFVITAFFIFTGAAFMSGIGNACFDTVLMEEIPEDHHGMVFGLTETISNTLIGVSMFFAGLATEFIQPRTMGLAGGLSYIFIGIFLLIAFCLLKSKSSVPENVNQ